MFRHNIAMTSEQKQIKKILVKNLKKYRLRSNLTQEEAAERADITTKYWQRLEMESQIDLPSLPTLQKLAKALEVQASDLIKE